jgi:hypothetical protein
MKSYMPLRFFLSQGRQVHPMCLLTTWDETDRWPSLQAFLH